MASEGVAAHTDHIMDTPVPREGTTLAEDNADASTPLLVNPHDGYEHSAAFANGQVKTEEDSNSSDQPTTNESTASHPQLINNDIEENANDSEDQRPGLHSRAESVESSLSTTPLDFARPRYPRIMSNSSSSIPYARHYRTDSTASNDFAFRRHNRFESTTSVFSMSSYRHSRAESTTSTTHLIWDAETNSVAGLESRYSMASDYRLSRASMVSDHRLSRASADLEGIQLYNEWSQKEEDDDELHIPEELHQPFVCLSLRGLLNMGMIFILFLALLMLFMGYPVLLAITERKPQTLGFGFGGINATGQIPKLRGLIDPDTPQEAMTRTGTDGEPYTLVFSDEFETEGRTFSPGDDPYLEADDLYYASTGDFEKYDPSAAQTSNGKLVLTMTLKQWENLNFQSAMLTSWNKFCFTTGYLEVSVSLPGSYLDAGFWPAIWTMGNLGRAGYRATTDGTWPYSYDSCDLGTFPNQTDKTGNPAAANGLSFLPGQRLSACTCPGSDHPGPSPSVGRGAPEIDVFEAQVDLWGRKGEVSQSFQAAPFDDNWGYNNAPPATTIVNSNLSVFNSFKGNVYQEALSVVSTTDPKGYNGSEYRIYGIEYWSNPEQRSEGFINWFSNDTLRWGITADAIGPNNVTKVSQRIIPEEPMAIIMNLGISQNFEAPDYEHLPIPGLFYIDYVRVYQREGLEHGVGCDPPGYPTASYIQNHPEAYQNYNKTVWAEAGYAKPLNSLYDGC